MVLVESQGYDSENPTTATGKATTLSTCSRVEWKTRTFEESWNCVKGECDCTRKTRTCSSTGVERIVDGTRHFAVDDHSFEENSLESFEESLETHESLESHESLEYLESRESPESDESDESASDESDESAEGGDWDCR